MANPFEVFLTMARTYGIYEFYLPFLLVLTLFYGLLQKTKILGDYKGAQGLNLIISVIAALYVMVYSPAAITITQFFANFFTQTSIVLVTLLVGIMLIVGLIPGFLSNMTWEQYWGEKKGGIFVFLAIFIGIGIFWLSGGPQLFSQISPIASLSPEDTILIALVLITIVVIWYMMREEKTTTPKPKQPGE